MIKSDYTSSILWHSLTIKIVHHLDVVRKYNQHHLSQKLKNFISYTK